MNLFSSHYKTKLKHDGKTIPNIPILIDLSLLSRDCRKWIVELEGKYKISDEEKNATIDINSAPIDINSAPINVNPTPIDIDHAPMDNNSAKIDIYYMAKLMKRIKLWGYEGNEIWIMLNEINSAIEWPVEKNLKIILFFKTDDIPECGCCYFRVEFSNIEKSPVDLIKTSSHDVEYISRVHIWHKHITYPLSDEGYFMFQKDEQKKIYKQVFNEWILENKNKPIIRERIIQDYYSGKCKPIVVGEDGSNNDSKDLPRKKDKTINGLVLMDKFSKKRKLALLYERPYAIKMHKNVAIVSLKNKSANISNVI